MVNVENQTVMVDDVTLSSFDIKTKNGILHVIDFVIFPHCY
ncbi:MAG: fasciclin domain-containing protein [Methanoregulaceae archaeon]|nr:fasciclin domain-containing protein [Methanoregulaceae archaeon]